MRIKAAKTHMKGGEPAYSYRLVKFERVGGKVRQVALPDLGTGFSVPREKGRELRRPGGDEDIRPDEPAGMSMWVWVKKVPGHIARRFARHHIAARRKPKHKEQYYEESKTAERDPGPCIGKNRPSPEGHGGARRSGIEAARSARAV